MATTPPSTPTKSLKAVVSLASPAVCDESLKTNSKQTSQVNIKDISEKTSGDDVLVSKEVTLVTKEIAQVSKEVVVSVHEVAVSVECEAKASVYPTPPASPVLQAEKVKHVSSTQLVVQDVQRKALYEATPKKTLLSAELITIRLNITKWLCGNKKANGQPCRWWSELKSESRRTEIRNLILKLSLVEVNSTAFDLALEELAQSYSCYHHNKGPLLEYRVTEWKNLLVPVTGTENQLRAVLWSISTCCVTCGKGIGGQRVQNCRKTSRLILDNKGTIEYHEYLLRVWDVNTRCNDHSSLRDETRVKEMVDRIKKIVSFSTESPCMLKEIEYYWPRTRTTTAFEAIHQWKDPTGENDPLKVLKYQVQTQLKGAEFDDGIVYIYEVDGNPGLLKIGYTGRTLESRRAWMEFECNRDCRILYYSKVPNAKRTEALCHADLHECRVQVACDGCIKNHNEWFRVSSLEAQAVLDKWATWMKSHPYETRSLRTGDQGYLKDSIKLKDMAKFKKDPMGAGA
ncbi:MAG: hypothetical protein GOMPHAMPRED_000735 [Gomphillus americanus]|uniref:Bacteriophage T5 Orf172 DNA-binding domain-containing protein n=1 Tax=Gomphillus americanus TaxID=1940652 RepID=A0A8H3F1B1_9LECA|nr:MAG: hypothetical protein GOMPHAMPRED_000735 [Gomphillus americanus]